jgi:hypothetical protein
MAFSSGKVEREKSRVEISRMKRREDKQTGRRPTASLLSIGAEGKVTLSDPKRRKV